jgi:methylglyoxal synthase
LKETEPRKGTAVAMPRRKSIALVAHDNKKADLLEWARYNRGSLAKHDLFGTGTTGKMVADALGGDQQIGAMIASGELDALIFFWDPLEPQPHDPDVKALLRIAVLYNIPTACNRASADFVISSPLILEEYERIVPAHEVGQRRVQR